MFFLGIGIGAEVGKAEKRLASGKGVALKSFIIANGNVVIFWNKAKVCILPIAAMWRALYAVVNV